MATKTEQTWLPTADEIQRDRNDFTFTYILHGASELFNAPFGAGYWLYGVEWNKKLGWLAYEFDESGEDWREMDHSAAIAAWRKGTELPEKYFVLNRAFADRAFTYACEKWGARWYQEHDLPMIDQVVQYTLLGEMRYG